MNRQFLSVLCQFLHFLLILHKTDQERNQPKEKSNKPQEITGSDPSRTAADKQGKAMTISQTDHPELNGSADVKMIRQHSGLVGPEPGAACVLTGV